MEETGENWPSDSDLDIMGDNDFCFDDEEFPCNDVETVDPMMGETNRKRRQRELEEGLLLALSATIPGLKNKMDDASILDKAGSYVKQLQQRVRELEVEQLVDSRSTCTNKGPTCGEVSGNENYGQDHHHQGTLPEVEARVLQQEVLVRIHCGKPKGILLKILSQLENLHLSVLNVGVLPFGKSTLNITIVAQIGHAYNMTVEELEKSLKLAILAQ